MKEGASSSRCSAAGGGVACVATLQFFSVKLGRGESVNQTH